MGFHEALAAKVTARKMVQVKRAPDREMIYERILKRHLPVRFDRDHDSNDNENHRLEFAHNVTSNIFSLCKQQMQQVGDLRALPGHEFVLDLAASLSIFAFK
jgi:hypothetical protein